MNPQTIKIEDCDLTLSQLARRLKSRTAIVTRNGKPSLRVSEISNVDVKAATPASRPKLLRKLDASEQDYFRRGGVSSDQVLKELGLISKPRKSSRTIDEIPHRGSSKSQGQKQRRRLAKAGASSH